MTVPLAPVGTIKIVRFERAAAALSAAVDAVALADLVADDAIRAAESAADVDALAFASALAATALADVDYAERRLARIARVVDRIAARIQNRMAVAAVQAETRP